MTKRGMSRWLDGFDVSLESMRSAAHTVDGSVNDAFLASVAGGLRRYHERHDTHVDALRVTMPINLRRSDDPTASNLPSLTAVDPAGGPITPGLLYGDARGRVRCRRCGG